jgi:hypothetical protein
MAVSFAVALAVVDEVNLPDSFQIGKRFSRRWPAHVK